MDAHKLKAIQAERRKHRVRKAIHGTAAQPRLSVFRSNQNIAAQLIDDDAQATLAAVASNGKSLKLGYGGNIAAAKQVGAKLAELAKAKGITKAAFDRGGYRFHGRVKALAQAAAAAGLICTGPPEPPKEKVPAAEKPAEKPKAEKKEKKAKEPAKA